MIDRFAQFPRDLAQRAKTVRIGDVPVLLAHPDWERPAPTVLWMHGRTANKELDPGRYLRWIRAGIAACAIDMPGHGERRLEGWDTPAHTMDALEQAIWEADRVVEHLSDPMWRGAFDLDRLAIGGMSLGGMATLRRLCDPHPFVAAAVESTSGWLTGLYFPEGRAAPAGVASHARERVLKLDPMAHLHTFRPVPLLALHSRADALVPFDVQERFIGRLREHYQGRGVGPSQIELVSWETTGAPQEHSGFGRVSNEAKNLQVAFLQKWLRPTPPPSSPAT
jgi:alpha-beta hydrolase superfamily lysophospholipase